MLVCIWTVTRSPATVTGRKEGDPCSCTGDAFPQVSVGGLLVQQGAARFSPGGCSGVLLVCNDDQKERQVSVLGEHRRKSYNLGQSLKKQGNCVPGRLRGTPNIFPMQVI